MIRRLTGHLTYANVVSTLCLFALLGGGAWAATKVAKNSVGSKQIKNGEVKSQDVKDNSLTGTDINESRLTLPQGPDGPKGPKGDQGEQGEPGVDGTDGVDGSPDTAGQVLAKLLTVDGAGSSLDADLLDGLSSGHFLAANAKASDSEKLDGLDSSAFARSSSIVTTGMQEVDYPGAGVNATNRETLAEVGPFTFTGACSSLPGVQRNAWIDITYDDSLQLYPFVESSSEQDSTANTGGLYVPGVQISDQVPLNTSNPKYVSQYLTLLLSNGGSFTGQYVTAVNLDGTDDCYFGVFGTAG